MRAGHVRESATLCFDDDLSSCAGTCDVRTAHCVAQGPGLQPTLGNDVKKVCVERGGQCRRCVVATGERLQHPAPAGERLRDAEHPLGQLCPSAERAGRGPLVNRPCWQPCPKCARAVGPTKTGGRLPPVRTNPHACAFTSFLTL